MIHKLETVELSDLNKELVDNIVPYISQYIEAVNQRAIDQYRQFVKEVILKQECDTVMTKECDIEHSNWCTKCAIIKELKL